MGGDGALGLFLHLGGILLSGLHPLGGGTGQVETETVHQKEQEEIDGEGNDQHPWAGAEDGYGHHQCHRHRDHLRRNRQGGHIEHQELRHAALRHRRRELLRCHPHGNRCRNLHIYYKVEENVNWNAADAQSVEVTIAPKSVIVTADNQTKEYGAADPTLTATVEGLVGQEDITYALSRAEGETMGAYAITPTGDATQGNYAVTYVAGTLTITMPTQVSITLPEEYGTYCCPVDLDFSEVTGLTAYIAAGYTKSAGSLLMVKVTSVPSGTGLLLKGTAGNTYTVKVQASPYVYSNLLTGTIAETDVTTGDLILGKSDDKLGFYRVSEPGTLAAGKAYTVVDACHAQNMHE